MFVQIVHSVLLITPVIGLAYFFARKNFINQKNKRRAYALSAGSGQKINDIKLHTDPITCPMLRRNKRLKMANTILDLTN